MVTLPSNNQFRTQNYSTPPRIPGGISLSMSALEKNASNQVKKDGQKRLIWLSIILGILVIGVLLWYSGSFTPPALPPSTPFNPEEVRISNIQRIPIDDIIGSPVFRSLRTHGVLPVVPDNLGRPNPFVPF